jgi:hypothetical protein
MHKSGALLLLGLGFGALLLLSTKAPASTPPAAAPPATGPGPGTLPGHIIVGPVPTTA